MILLQSKWEMSPSESPISILRFWEMFACVSIVVAPGASQLRDILSCCTWQEIHAPSALDAACF